MKEFIYRGLGSVRGPTSVIQVEILRVKFNRWQLISRSGNWFVIVSQMGIDCSKEESIDQGVFSNRLEEQEIDCSKNQLEGLWESIGI